MLSIYTTVFGKAQRICILYQKKVKVKSLSCVRLFVTPWTVAHQAPQSMGFSRQEYWSRLPISFSRESSRPKDRTQVSRIAGRRFNLWATRELPYYIKMGVIKSIATYRKKILRASCELMEVVRRRLFLGPWKMPHRSHHSLKRVPDL